MSWKTAISSAVGKFLLGLPWPEIAGEAWKYTRKVLQGYAQEGMYEVISLDTTLELKNQVGSRARFKKRKHIRYLQNNTIAFQDYAWGDGKILLNYRSSIGKAVDQYRLGYKTYLLLSLRDVKNRDEEDVYEISWDMRDGFLEETCFWETDISQRTQHLSMSVIFPKSRLPQKASVLEVNHRKTHPIKRDEFEVLPDGRVRVSWEREKPRLFEHYLLKWTW